MVSAMATKKNQSSKSTDGLTPTTEQQLVDSMESPRRIAVDPEIWRMYDAYVKDWRWNMATFLQLQSEYMPRRRSLR